MPVFPNAALELREGQGEISRWGARRSDKSVVSGKSVKGSIVKFLRLESCVHFEEFLVASTFLFCDWIDFVSCFEFDCGDGCGVGRLR